MRGSTHTYSVPNVANNAYNWTVAGGTIQSGAGTNSISVLWGAGASGTVDITQTITASGCAANATQFPVTINPLPTPVITGTSPVCAGSTHTYSVPNVANNTYNWTVAGGTIQSGAGTNSISVLWGAGASGTVDITQTITASGCAANATQFPVTINPLPTPVITGTSPVCAGSTHTYSVPNVANNAYNWTVAGGTIQSGAGTNSISVLWGAGASGTVDITQTITASGCAANATQFPVTINPLPTPVITGTSPVCAGSTHTYSVPNVANNTYNWTVAGGTIQSGAGTNSISVLWGAGVSGTVDITQTITASGCAANATQFPVTINPLPTPVITGTSPVCAGSTHTYSVPNVANNTYNWTVAGGTIQSGAGTNSISVLWGAGASGTVDITQTITASGCAANATQFPVTINPLPTPVITGTSPVCAGSTHTYSVPNVANNAYNWTVAGGTIQSGAGTNSISVLWGAGASGTVDITQTITASGCAANATQFPVTINPLPTPVITGTSPVCAGSTHTYSVPNVANNTYNWTVAGGTIQSGAGTNSISVLWGAGVSGTVDITQTITASGCAANATQFPVTINPLPTPVITGTSPVCAGSTHTYSVPNVANNTYNWTVAGGTIQSGAGTNSISVLWGAGASGTVDITQTITASGCAANATQFPVTNNPLPTPVITGSLNVCGSSTETYTVPNTAGNTYTWTVTNGTFPIGQQGTASINVTWGASGTGKIELTETISASSCLAVATPIDVTIFQIPNTDITGTFTACEGDTLTYTATSAPAGQTYNYTWTANGGTLISPQGSNPIQIRWDVSNGTEYVLVNIQIATTSCQATTPIPAVPGNMGFVVVNPIPTPVISGDNQVCANESGVTYQTPPTANRTYVWNVTGGTIQGASNTDQITVLWGSAGTGTVRLTETITPSGCDAKATDFAVTINGIPTTPSALDRSLCTLPDTVHIMATEASAVDFNWYDAATNGTNLFTGNPFVTPSINTSVSYWVAAVNAAGCEGLRKEVKIIANPTTADIQLSDTTIVVADSVSLNTGQIEITVIGNNAPYTFDWRDATNTQVSTTEDLSCVPLGDYSVTILDGGGCSRIFGPFTIQKGSQVNIALGDIKLPQDTLIQIAIGAEVNLTAEGLDLTSVRWLDNANVEIGTTENITFNVPGTEGVYNYTMEVTNAKGCIIMRQLRIEAIRLNLFVPNAFSPSGKFVDESGGTDKDKRLRVYGTGIKSVNFRVYNRLGELVFETNQWVEGILDANELDFGWDGNYKGKAQENGNYVWNLSVTYLNDTKINKTGNVLLIR